MEHSKGKMKTSRHHFPLEINMLRRTFEQQGKGVGVGAGISPPTKPSGFITQTKPFHSADQEEVYTVIL